MFEINITNSSNSVFSGDSGKWYGYNAELHQTYHYNSFGVYIRGLKYKKDKEDIFENENFLIIRCGQVFYSLKYKDNLYPLSASDILSLYLRKDVSFLDKIKGNFILVIYAKIDKKLIIAKDKLGLKYLYYKIENNFYYISTNINDFKRLNTEYDYNTILQHILFSYPIGNSAFIKGVKFLEMGSFLFVEQNNITKKRYFFIDDIFVTNGDVKKFQKNNLVSLFKRSVLQRANASSTPNVSLTGGFDGRAITAVLLKAKHDFKAYSFGMKGGENTEVPMNVSKKIGFDYNPIHLNDEYENRYPSCANDTIYFSDGISRFERANYIFAVRKLALKTHINITGLIGGEIFGPVHLKTDYINEEYFNTIYLSDQSDLQSIFTKYGIIDFLSYGFAYSHSSDNVFKIIELRRKIVNGWRSGNFPWMYYLKDLITLGFQRFYGNQMHMERYYCDNLTPFYDIDVLEYLFSTDHINIYRNAYKNSPIFRIRNRKLQSIIIKNQFKELGKLPLDRGYPPNYNLDIRKLSIPYFFYKRKWNYKTQKPDFDSPHWCSLLFKQLVEDSTLYHSDLINLDRLKSYLLNYQPEQYRSEINRIIGLSIWLKKS